MACMNTFQWSYGYDIIHRESQSPILNFNTAGLFFTPLDLRLRPNNAITHDITYNPRPLCPPLLPLTTFLRALFINPLAMKLAVAPLEVRHTGHRRRPWWGVLSLNCDATWKVLPPKLEKGHTPFPHQLFTTTSVLSIATGALREQCGKLLAKSA